MNYVFCIMEDVNDSTQDAAALAPAAQGAAASSNAASSNGTRAGAAGGVQSIERAFDLLEMLADAGGALGLSELSTVSGLPLPTVHRLMRTLVNRGYVRQEASRRYTLGSRLIRLGEISSQMLGTWLRPFLAQLVRLTGETANLAMLDGDEVVYIAQVPSPHSMRMFTEPGRRVHAVDPVPIQRVEPAHAEPFADAGHHVDVVAELRAATGDRQHTAIRAGQVPGEEVQAGQRHAGLLDRRGERVKLAVGGYRHRERPPELDRPEPRGAGRGRAPEQRLLGEQQRAVGQVRKQVI